MTAVARDVPEASISTQAEKMTTDEQPEIQGLGQVALPVHELERAVAFYRDALGLRFLFDAPGLAFFDLGGVRLMLAEPETDELEPPGSILYYRVRDVKESHLVLASRGVRFEEPPRVVHRAEDCELWMAAFRDPEGNLGALMSEAPTS